MFANRNFVEILAHSDIYRDYERAFTDATGLPVSLRPVESWQLPHRGKKSENGFCALMAQRSGSCAACLRVQEQLSQTARTEPQSVTCFSGMSDTAVPVRLGENLVGFLQTGQVFRRKPTEEQFSRVTRQLAEWGHETANPGELRDAFFSTRVLTRRQHEAMVTLLRIFALHLSSVANQLLVRKQNAEPPMITRAKEFIGKNQGEDLSLGRVAKAVNTSTFYFCKMFKKATGSQFHRLRLPDPDREGEKPPAEPEPEGERDRLRGGLPIADPLQPGVQEDRRRIADRVPGRSGLGCLMHCLEAEMRLPWGHGGPRPRRRRTE